MENNEQKRKDEKLLKALAKSESLDSIQAAKEVLGRGGISGKHLCHILQIKERGINEQEVKEIKAEAEGILIEKFLDEKSFLTILNEGSPIAKIRAAEKYRSENENISNYLLRQVVSGVPKCCSWAAEKLLKQYKTTEDLLTIIEELEGIDPQLQRRAWEELCKLGMPIDDACYIIGFIESLAKLTFQKLIQEGTIEGLSDGQLTDVSLSDEPEISEWAVTKRIEKRQEKQKELNEKIEANLKKIERLKRSNELELIKTKLKKLEENKEIRRERADIEIEIKQLEEKLKRTSQEAKAVCPPP